jgi:hypothetical protein
MSLEGKMNQAVSVLPFGAGAEDEYHLPADGYGSPVPYRGYLEQQTSEEITDGRATRVRDWLLILPADAAIDALDRVTEGGRTFEVVGEPNKVRNPRTQAYSHIEARLRLVEG